MEERRDPGGQEPQEEKDYAFMQEVIKDETGSRKFKRDVRRMAGLGLVFGLVACVTFCVFGPGSRAGLRRQGGSGDPPG